MSDQCYKTLDVDAPYLAKRLNELEADGFDIVTILPARASSPHQTYASYMIVARDRTWQM